MLLRFYWRRAFWGAGLRATCKRRCWYKQKHVLEKEEGKKKSDPNEIGENEILGILEENPNY